MNGTRDTVSTSPGLNIFDLLGYFYNQFACVFAYSLLHIK